MISSDNQHSSSLLHNKSTPSTSLFSDNQSSKILPYSNHLTPDPSPNMNPEDPSTSSANATSASPSLPAERDTHLSNNKTNITLPAPNMGSNNATTPSFPPSASSSPVSSRPIHPFYSNATPPMSPAHSLLSPASNSHYNNSDHNHQYLNGFYQLPPPLQSLKPRDSMHQSPKLAPHQSNHSISLPPPRSTQPAGYNGMSPRSKPQQSSHMHHPQSSPLISSISPYPTPQSHPQNHSSPHQSPRYEGHQGKHPIPPSMSLPASSLPSTSVFHVMSPRPYPSPHTSSGTNNTSNQGSQLKSPKPNISQRTTPNSPQRFMMLPPQTAPAMALARQAKAANASSSKRRASSGSKVVDQEAREMMRKVSHSAIERRRRERINDKILQLKHLVPACIDEDHLHKLSILQSTIEYIQYLKSVVPESVANAKFQKATNSNPNNKTTDMLDAVNASNSSTMIFAPMMTTGLGNPYSKRVKTSHPSTPQQSTADKSPSVNPLSSDEDAKDGLLLLSQLSSNTSPSLTPNRGDQENSSRTGTDKYNDKDDENEFSQNDSEESGMSEDEDYREEDEEEEEEVESKETVNADKVSRRGSSKMSVEKMLCQ